MRALIGCLRLFLYILLCALLIPLQALVLVFTKGPPAFVIPVAFHKTVCALFSIRVETIGAPAAHRHIVFLSNHLSYLDIEAISAVMPTSFVAKEEVADWPLFGLLAKLQQTVFISRDPKHAEEGRARFAAALARQTPLVLFAEGTSSDGAQVLPFKSSLFEIFYAADRRSCPLLQPMTISLLDVDGRPVTDSRQRDRYAYYGDIVLAPHLWEFAKGRGARLRLTFHAPLQAAAFPGRKELAAAAHSACSGGLEFANHEGHQQKEARRA